MSLTVGGKKMIEIINLAYDNPGTTFLFLLGLAFIASEFTPILHVTSIRTPEKKKEKEENEKQ